MHRDPIKIVYENILTSRLKYKKHIIKLITSVNTFNKNLFEKNV